MSNLITLLTAWTVAAAAAAQRAPSQAPAWSPGPAPGSADCSTLMLDLVDCTLFLEEGGPETKPKSSCCSGLKSVLEADAECVCYALRRSGSLGIHVNMSRAEALPSACRVSAPPISNCHVSVSPTEAPVSASPSGSPVSASPANSPVNAPSSNYPTLAPFVPAFVSTPAPSPTTNTGEAPVPTSNTATKEPPTAAPYGAVSGLGPAPQIAAPSPSNSGVLIIPVTFRSFLVVVGSFLVVSSFLLSSA